MRLPVSRWCIILPAVALAGCADDGTLFGPDLRVDASWEDLHHLHVVMANDGDVAFLFEREDLSVTNPTGEVPLFLETMPRMPPIGPGRYVDMTLHGRLFPEGAWGLSADHVHGVEAPAPPGTYVVCVAVECVEAVALPAQPST